MINKWNKNRLGDLMEITSSKRIFANEYLKDGIPFYRGKEIIEKNKGNTISTELFISSEKYNSIKKDFGVPKEGDLLLTSVGTLGIPYIVKKNENFYFKDGNLTWFRNYSNINNKYLYYWLHSPIGTEQLAKQTIGSTQQALTISGLKSIEIALPSINVQLSIAQILSSLDNKIELLREENKTLESIAQLLFKRWFVDFEFPNEEGKPYKTSGGKINNIRNTLTPENWNIGKIEDLTVFMNSGGTPSTQVNKYYNGDIDWFSTKELHDIFLFSSEKKISNTGLKNSSTKLFPKNTVLMAIYAAPTVGRLGILTHDATFNQAAIGLVAKEEIASYEYIYLLLKHLRKDFNNLANGAAQQNLNVKLVKEFKVTIPSINILENFRQIVHPIFNKILINSREILQLTSLRNLLLPILMEGKLEIK